MRMLRQLGREDWILAGLHALAKDGDGGLRVEPVARGLGVTKGSFYWHFPDRAGWRQAVLSWWEHRAFADLARGRPRAGKAGEPDWAAVEQAIRLMAQTEVAAAQSLSRVLRERALAGAQQRAA